ncbi:MAG TPA: hypothetical protein VFA35_02885 [Burkholderiaceae bacterium]|nr:hypothetical protein [Burkholderiaceae bacterium]
MRERNTHDPGNAADGSKGRAVRHSVAALRDRSISGCAVSTTGSASGGSARST